MSTEKFFRGEASREIEDGIDRLLTRLVALAKKHRADAFDIQSALEWHGCSDLAERFMEEAEEWFE